MMDGERDNSGGYKHDGEDSRCSEENLENEENEYERERRERVAANNVFLQSALDAATVFNSSIKKRAQRPKRTGVHLESNPKRVSQRIAVSQGRRREEGCEVPSSAKDIDNRDDEDENYVPTEGEESSPSEEEDTSQNRVAGVSNNATTSKRPVSPAKGNSRPLNSVRDAVGFHAVPHDQCGNTSRRSAPTLCTPAGVQIPSGWTVIPVPQVFQTNEGISFLGTGSNFGFQGPQGAFQPPSDQVQQDRNKGVEDVVDTGGAASNSTLNSETQQRKQRRLKKKIADEEARRRQGDGLKPYVVQVKPSGIVDSGCLGHLKWQEFIRDLTPRFLDMSVLVYEEQTEDSRKKLLDCFDAKFEYLDNEVTLASFDKMIKTWMRKNRERVKRNYGGKPTPPPRFNPKQWESMNKYWDLPITKGKSEEMTNKRRKVQNNPRVGRTGYSGKKTKLQLERTKSPPVTDFAAELKSARGNPSNEDMEKKNSSRLSIMERNHLETNRRLDEVMKSNLELQKSNLNLQGMLENVLHKFTKEPVLSPTAVEGLSEPREGREVSPQNTKFPVHKEGNRTGEESSERWWDKLAETSNDEDCNDRKTRKVVKQAYMKGRGKEIQDLSGATARKEMDSQLSASSFGTKHAKQSVKSKMSEAVEKNIGFEVRVGSRVWLADTLDPERRVASGQVMALGGQGLFHTRPIPPQYIRVNLEKVIEDLPLMVPVEDAEQANLSDALGSSVLSFKGWTFLDE